MTISDHETVRLEAQVPRRLLDRIQAFVASGQYRDLDEVLLEALRRYADSHGEALDAQFVHEDVEWGMRGSD
ncbi:MAG TPA: CopG family transcriptional regulator [Thermoanaerobaculia bacterium]|nr:CopG family transcriptional regulator [Thermoanaerobaculia bacterium]